jgi:putative transposase
LDIPNACLICTSTGLIDNSQEAGKGRTHVGQSLKGEDVVAVIQRLHQQLGLVPERIQVDIGSAFISKVLDRGAYDQYVMLDFFRPGKPTDNPYIESITGSSRDEYLSVH